MRFNSLSNSLLGQPITTVPQIVPISDEHQWRKKILCDIRSEKEVKEKLRNYVILRHLGVDIIIRYRLIFMNLTPPASTILGSFALLKSYGWQVAFTPAVLLP